jgi:hypothetical protein
MKDCQMLIMVAGSFLADIGDRLMNEWELVFFPEKLFVREFYHSANSGKVDNEGLTYRKKDMKPQKKRLDNLYANKFK